MSYNSFLDKKKVSVISTGIPEDFQWTPHESLFDFQVHILKESLRKGRYAIFADCGLGKTRMQLEFARVVMEYTNKPVLIVAPLGVGMQTIDEAKTIYGNSIPLVKYTDQTEPGLYITNYEQLDNIDEHIFSGVVLDESSILKSVAGKLRSKIIEKFKNTPFKLPCTATPSPNDLMEIANHSEFLNVMSRTEMLAMFFVHDGGETAKWRLKKHAHANFYNFLAEWAMVIHKPSDLGFSDEGYDLPELHYHTEILNTELKDDCASFFNETAINATDYNRELRRTMTQRMDRAIELANNSDEPCIIWVKQNIEADYLRKRLEDCREVRGSDKIEKKESDLLGFAKNEFTRLVTKTKIAQFGLNYQNAHKMIFASIDFSFESVYQAIKRMHRFGQQEEVHVHIITTDTMKNTIDGIRRKEKEHNAFYSDFKNRNGKYSQINNEGSEMTEWKNDGNTLINGDCVKAIKTLPDESIHFSVFSPPFADLYVYSDKLEDMGNSSSHDEFLEHFKYLVEELSRVMMSGRNVAVHCMDIPAQKGKDGYIGLKDFSGDMIRIFQENGFIYHDRVTIWKNPVVEMQRTKALGLLHKQVKKDSTMSRTGIPDYLLVFRKKGENKEPITNTGIPVDLWQKYASPVWNDIDYGDTLQFRSARSNDDERHICPLQLPTIERAIHLWSNPGDMVLSPFAGIGSEGYQAIKMKRKFTGFELKESYFKAAAKNLSDAVISENSTFNFNL